MSGRDRSIYIAQKNETNDAVHYIVYSRLKAQL